MNEDSRVKVPRFFVDGLQFATMPQRTVNENVDLSDNISSIAADACSPLSDQRPGRLPLIRPADIYQQFQEQNDMANVPSVAHTTTTEA